VGKRKHKRIEVCSTRVDILKMAGEFIEAGDDGGYRLKRID
jgi:hypothetical protein